ncbi:hypothetical protein IJ531_02220, partial [bacterium]|nr:hypothetical protein [bacterium]
GNSNIDEAKELYMRAKKRGEVYELTAREYVNFKSENKREPQPEEMYEILKRNYNRVETNYKKNAIDKITGQINYNKEIAYTVPKYGETRVLTYFADNIIPQISRDLGIKLTSVEGSRYRAGDKGGHGAGRKLDISMSEHSRADKIKIMREVLAHPLVNSIGTSDPEILKFFSPGEYKEGEFKHPKIRNLTRYDADYRIKHPNTRMNHVNHIDISLNTNYGGAGQQGINLNAAPKNYSTIKDKPVYMSYVK